MVKILFVCLGNICRSPTAEGVVRALAARDYPLLRIEVDSAGTADYHVGEPPDRRTIVAARERGYELSDLRPRLVTVNDFRNFDHILAMDRANLHELEILRPSGARAHLGLFLQYAPEAGVEIPDPYTGGPEDFARVVDLCEAAAAGLLRALAHRK